MDSDGIVGLAAVILLFGGGTLFLLSVSPVGKAFVARISERVDFLERLVARQCDAERLAPPGAR